MMAVFTLQYNDTKLVYTPECAAWELETPQGVWNWRSDASLQLSDGRRLYFKDAACTAERYDTGTGEGVRAVYTAFSPDCAFSIHTWIGFDRADGVLRCTVRAEGDARCEIARIYWPAAIEFDLPEGEGYTVLPQMHGSMIPTRWPREISQLSAGILNGRDGYMPMFGQVKGEAAYCAIYETDADAGYYHGHTPGGKTEVEPFWLSSLGHFEPRTLLYTQLPGGDYNAIAKCYRRYVQARGKFVTLAEKIARNPNVAYLIGAPVLHTGVAVHISEQSLYYKPDEPEHNDHYTPFSEIAKALRGLRARGMEKAYIHLDGWGAHGYDNLHPDVFPIHEAAGGADGMRMLSDTCRELGYRFGIHDQYRDYYLDAPSYDPAMAVENADGSNTVHAVWFGGPQTLLCAKLAPAYVRRNYAEFDRLGIRIDGSYLDVFSVVELDECFSKEHPMTRAECAQYRNECFRYLSGRGIITQSEEVVDSIIPELALCHHAPLPCMGFEGELESSGIPIPLFSLVYHECIVIPWSGLHGENGGWSIPKDKSAFLYGLMTGGTVYIHPGMREKGIEKATVALDLQAKLAHCELVSHAFLPDGREQTVFSDGTRVTVDFAAKTYEIE